MKGFLRVLFILAAVVGMFFISSSSAHAGGNPWLEAYKASSKSSGSAKVTILSFVRAKGLSKRVVRQADKCINAGPGTRHPDYWTDGINGVSGGRQAFKASQADLRTSRICKFGKSWVRVECGNRVWFKRPPKIVKIVTGRVKLVKSFGKFKVRARAKASAYVSGSCGWARASASASAVAYGRTLAQARGNARIASSGKATARAYAYASVQLRCSTTTPPPPPQGCPPGSIWNGHKCVKDGSATPPPPPIAPGPNPPPSGGPGDPGSNKCYSETTGKPVAPLPDGRCPVGSWGA